MPEPVDIWACGVVLYALLCGDLPFSDFRKERLVAKVRAGSCCFPGYVSDRARNLVMRLLRVNPHKRVTAAAVLEDPWLAQEESDLLPQLARTLRRELPRVSPLSWLSS